MKILPILLLCVVSVFYPIYGWAACSWDGNTGTVADPYSATQVQECINDAASKTGAVIIQIPNSAPTWSGGITVNMRSSWANVTSLTIRGQNDCTLNGNGIPTACGTNITNFSVTYTGLEGKAFRLSNMRWTGATSANPVYITGTGKSWRIDHIFFDHTTAGRIIYMNEAGATDVTYGLIDSCNVHDVGGVFLHTSPSNGGNYGWIRALDLGGPDATYIENSTFYWTTWNASVSGVTDANGPGRYVIRYNDITNGYIFAHDAIVNGHRGVRKWEVYNNTFTYSGSNCFVFAGRAGTGVFFNNTISDPELQLCPQYIQLACYRTGVAGQNPWDALCSNTSGKGCLGTASPYPQNCTTDADCGGVAGSCIAKDATTGSPTGYPCRDQLGFDGNNPQTSRPFLLWNNTKNGSDITVGIAYNTSYIAEGRDYCKHPTTMPASCNGVTTNYTPYTYPHPLRQSQAGDNPPEKPQNLRITE